MHGFSLGLAIDLATAADVRICSKDTRFSVKEVDVGMAADVGTLARLPRVVGSLSWVKDVCYSGRDFFADEALAVGLVSQVQPSKAAALDAAFKMAAFWSTKSPVAVQGTKELLNHARDHTIDESEYHELFFLRPATFISARLCEYPWDYWTNTPLPHRPPLYHYLEFGHAAVGRL